MPATRSKGITICTTEYSGTMAQQPGRMNKSERDQRNGTKKWKRKERALEWMQIVEWYGNVGLDYRKCTLKWNQPMPPSIQESTLLNSGLKRTRSKICGSFTIILFFILRVLLLLLWHYNHVIIMHIRKIYQTRCAAWVHWCYSTRILPQPTTNVPLILFYCLFFINFLELFRPYVRWTSIQNEGKIEHNEDMIETTVSRS